MFSAISAVGNTTTLVLLVTELMGLYAIFSLLLIRKQLPIKYRCRAGVLLFSAVSRTPGYESCIGQIVCMGARCSGRRALAAKSHLSS